MKKKSKFIPYDVYESIYSIDYDKLLIEGKKVIIFDLDNTIMPYHIKKPTEIVRLFMDSLKEKGFIPILMSNNHKRRITRVGKFLDIDFIYDAKKPFKFGYHKVLNLYKEYKKKEFICIGDQIITDVYGANRVGLDCILVKPILLENEHWYTKINRMTERKIINKFKIKNPSIFTKIRNIRGDIKG